LEFRPGSEKERRKEEGTAFTKKMNSIHFLSPYNQKKP
jgi:hypothetical protein